MLRDLAKNLKSFQGKLFHSALRRATYLIF